MTALSKLALGALLWAAGGALLRQAKWSPEAAPGAPQTLREGEPPALVGPRYDDDGSLPAASPRVATYTLDARLDGDRHAIEGKGKITWRNASSRPATELWFHLYLNAFKNNRTVFLRSPFGGARSGKSATVWGYVDVKTLKSPDLGGGELWPAAAARQGEDPEDETDVRVPLPRAVLPGETLTLEVEWTSQLPEIVERTGYQRDFHMVGQWFPKLARREPDGAWVHFPFHSQSEFYADFGSYDVTLDVPAGMVVGASGVPSEEAESGGRKRVRYRIDDVHDFAFTAWPGFLERSETMDGVRVRLLYPKGNERNAGVTLAAVRHGLAYFGRAYGRYPYPVLTVVHPPQYAPAAGGMEYPTLITTGFPWYTSYFTSFVERVTLHELAHQWFYGLVATDEHASPFLDEGLATFAESKAMRAMFGSGDGYTGFGLRIAGDAYLRTLAVEAGKDDAVGRPAAAFESFQKIGELVYSRTGVLLETLARVYGPEHLDRALGRYARRYRYEHPNPKHLLSVVREVLGDEAAEALHAGLFEAGTVDFAAGALESARIFPPEGIFDRPSGRERAEGASGSAKEERTGRLVVYRRGTLRLPVEVEIALTNGSRVRRRVDGRERWTAVGFEGRPESAVVDPDAKLLIDEDLSNNATRSGASQSPRLVERGVYAAELLLGALGP